jgi:ferric-dicitrate binding protein FerR (iron transport regulator)
MKPIGCGRAQALLAGRAAGLSASERDALHAHLQTCGDCREQARLLDEIILAVGAMPSRTPAARERTIERALRQGLAQAPEPLPPFWKSRSALAVGGVVVAGALAVIVVFLIMSGSWRPPQPPVAAQPSAQAQVTPLAAEPRDLPAGAEVAVAHARVRAVRRASISWNEKAATVRLNSGAIELDVDPTLQRHFRVATDSFVVEVLGTLFLVDASHVEVSRGAVRVLAPDGRILVARLQVGQTWPPLEAAPAVSGPAPEPERRARGPQPADVAEQLSRARRDLANRQVARAEKEASSIFAEARDRRQEAEAHTLLAECAQARGKIDRAVAGYVAVAERFGDLPAGETALFAAGRTLADAGRRVSAAHWLHRYLDRYPSGRFTVEAKERLAAIEGNRP